MVAERGRLVGAVRASERLRRYAEQRPLQYTRWTRPQLGWLSSSHPRKLLRAGNQIGKTWVGLSEVIYRATGTHPYVRTHPPPVEIWIVCTAWAQSVLIMGKFWELVPKHLIRPVNYSARWGFGKENPAVEFLNGSIVRFRTTNQGAEALAGSTVHYVLVDEPTDEEIYRELDRRLMRNAGSMGLTLTPINRPVDYLRELVKAGVVEDHHVRMTPEAFVPLGTSRPLTLLDGTPMDQDWIDEQRRTVLGRFQPVVLDGEWEMRIEGQVFDAFDVATHVTAEVPDVDLVVCIGFDHGDREFAQFASLVGLDVSGDYPRVHVLDESWSDGATTPDQDARAAIRMLSRWGWHWRDINHAWGDRVHHGPYIRKSNRELERAIIRELGSDPAIPLAPRIRQVKTGRGGGRGSEWRGLQWLHHAMLRPGHFTIHPRAKRTIDALQRYDLSDSDYKHPIDTLRYATWQQAMYGRRSARRDVSVQVG